MNAAANSATWMARETAESGDAVARLLDRSGDAIRAAGKLLADGLTGLPHVTGVRGLGLLLAAELEDRDGREIAAKALEAGLVVNGVGPTSLRFAPSLLVSEAEIDEALSILEGVLA